MNMYTLETSSLDQSLQSLRQKAAKAGKSFRLIGIITGVLICFINIILFGSLNMSLSENPHFLAQALRLLSAIISALVVTIALFVISDFFLSISQSKSPIRTKQVKLLRIVGFLLIAAVAIDIAAQLVFPDFTLTAHTPGQIEVQYAPAPTTTYLNVNFSNLLSALFCYCLSYVFKYIVRLQELSDETI